MDYPSYVPPETSQPGRHHLHVPIVVGISRKADFVLPPPPPCGPSPCHLHLSTLRSFTEVHLWLAQPYRFGASRALPALTASENLSEKPTSLFDF